MRQPIAGIVPAMTKSALAQAILQNQTTVVHGNRFIQLFAMAEFLIRILSFVGLWMIWMPISFVLTMFIMTPYIVIRSIFDEENYGVAVSNRFKNVIEQWKKWGFLSGPPF